MRAFMAHNYQKTDSDRLSQEIADLKSLNTAQSRERWRTVLAGRRTLARLVAVANPRFGVDSLTLRPMACGETHVVSC